MVYLLDDDQLNSIRAQYKCDFVFTSPEIKYYKTESELDFTPENVADSDFVCYHNSFPSDKTLFTNRLVEVQQKIGFCLICFSAAADFENVTIRDRFIKIHKDRFYKNLSAFIKADKNVQILLYGSDYKKAEMREIISQMNKSLFPYEKSTSLPLAELKPSTLKRFCLLAGIDYDHFLARINGFSIEQFRSYINTIIQSE